MNKFFKNIFIGGAILSGTFSLIFSASVSAAVNLNQAGGYLDDLAGPTGAGLEKDITVSVGNVINTLLAVVGTVFFILTIYAGIRWMTAQGAEEKVTKAKDTLQAALIGLAIVMLAYAITAFVTTRLGGGAVPGSAPAGGGSVILPTACETAGGEQCRSTVNCFSGLSGEEIPGDNLCDYTLVCCSK